MTMFIPEESKKETKGGGGRTGKKFEEVSGSYLLE